MPSPQLDPTAIFEIYRGSYGTELLTSAVVHFQYFSRLAAAARDFESLRGVLGLATRPMHVLTTALRSFGLVQLDAHGRLALTPLAREHLVPGSPFDVRGYVGLSADSPGVREMVERLRTNRPAGALEPDAGTAFIYREGLESAIRPRLLLVAVPPVAGSGQRRCSEEPARTLLGAQSPGEG